MAKAKIIKCHFCNVNVLDNVKVELINNEKVYVCFNCLFLFKEFIKKFKIRRKEFDISILNNFKTERDFLEYLFKNG